ncbi:hypothetical protein Misp01_01880 [Microtetraspora sp. NBRC 13810]|nr:hypothetical protein Misp01_01880 [Microtetraspora sp. NBRC 13810]
MCLIGLFSKAAYNGRIAAPGIPKTVSTPSEMRTSTTASMQGTLFIGIPLPPNDSWVSTGARGGHAAGAAPPAGRSGRAPVKRV